MGLVMGALERRRRRVVALPTGETLLRADEWVPQAPCDGAFFERVDLAHGRVALRATDGRYLARHLVHPVGPSDVGSLHQAALDGPGVTLVDELGLCTAFEELRSPDGHVALRGCDMRFLGVHADGSVVADRVTDGSWERFRYLEVPAPAPSGPAVPGCPAPLAAV